MTNAYRYIQNLQKKLKPKPKAVKIIGSKEDIKRIKKALKL